MNGEEILEAITVVCELTGAQLSPAGKVAMVEDLSAYPLPTVLAALTRCRRELRRGQFTFAEVVARLDDGRPGAEEAWAMLPRDDEASVVWTSEMSSAWGLVRHMLAAGEDVPARMAFKEAYMKAVAAARDRRTPVKWTPCLGADKLGHESILSRAVELGRLPKQVLFDLLPADRANEVLQLVAPTTIKVLK